MPDIHVPNIIGPIELAADPGTTGQVLTSTGPGTQPIWNTPLYAYADKTSQVMGTSGDVTWNPPAVLNGIAYIGPGIFTLPPNKTYLLDAYMCNTAGGDTVVMQWVDDLNNLLPLALSPGYVGNLNNESRHCLAVFTPLVTTNVKVRKLSGPANTFGVSSFLAITSI